MNRLAVVLLLAALLPPGAWADEAASDLVFVEGGPFRNTKSNYYAAGIVVPSFYIGRHEVTQKQWVEVMGDNPAHFRDDDRPVEMVTWYDCVEYCNKRSLREGLSPCYRIDKGRKDSNNRTTI